MARRERKNKAFLIKTTYRIYCPEKQIELDAEDGEIHTSSSECELCGSHGTTTLDIDCPGCNKSHEIVIDEW